MQMSWEKPDWYMTTEEFSSVVVDTLDSLGYFKKGESAHPEDIVISFNLVAEAVAAGAGSVIKKMYQKKRSL